MKVPSECGQQRPRGRLGVCVITEVLRCSSGLDVLKAFFASASGVPHSDYEGIGVLRSALTGAPAPAPSVEPVPVLPHLHAAFCAAHVTGLYPLLSAVTALRHDSVTVSTTCQLPGLQLLQPLYQPPPTTKRPTPQQPVKSVLRRQPPEPPAAAAAPQRPSPAGLGALAGLQLAEGVATQREGGALPALLQLCSTGARVERARAALDNTGGPLSEGLALLKGVRALSGGWGSPPPWSGGGSGSGDGGDDDASSGAEEAVAWETPEGSPGTVSMCIPMYSPDAGVHHKAHPLLHRWHTPHSPPAHNTPIPSFLQYLAPVPRSDRALASKAARTHSQRATICGLSTAWPITPPPQAFGPILVCKC